MKFTYAVTFESLTLPPETVRGDAEATSWHTAASRALKAARKSLPGKQASSIVVLLEKCV